MDRMSEEVKAARHYDASRRQEQARQNRWAVLQCARHRFLEDGYASTTIVQVARDAGVSVETVYKAFTNKAGLLKAVFDVSVAGDDEAVPISERDFIQAIIDEPDAARKITMYTDHLARIASRTAPVQLLARDAAAANPDAAEVWTQMRAEMLVAMTSFADNLATTGRLRPKTSRIRARDVLWTYHAPELYELLVLERGWSSKRYGEFLAEGIIAALLADPSPTKKPPIGGSR
jgi:AcrR family transcriptional regulator